MWGHCPRTGKVNGKVCQRQKKNRRQRRFFSEESPGGLSCSASGLTLGELLGAACGAQADLLTFDFTSVTRHEAGLAQDGLERCVIVDQGAGDAVAGRAGLAGFTGRERGG